MQTHHWMSFAAYLMINAILFGVGAVIVLSVPPLAANAVIILPLVIIVALVAAVPIANEVAKRMRLRYWDRRNEEPGFPLR